MKRRYNDLLEKIFGGPLSIFNRTKLSGDDIVKKWKYTLISIYAHDYAVAKDNGDKKRVVIEKRKMDIAKKLRTIDDIIKYGKALNLAPSLIQSFAKVRRIMAENDGLVPERITLSMGI